MKRRALTIPLLAVLMAACSSAPPSSEIPVIDQKRVLALYQNYQSDYIVEATPSDLARTSQLAIAGEIAAVREGRTWEITGLPWSRWTSVIVVVRSVTTLGGTDADAKPSEVFVELPNPSNVATSEFDGALPIGARAVFYLSRAAATGEVPDIISSNGNQDIDRLLFLPVSPQGFGIEDLKGQVVIWPLAGTAIAGELGEAKPGGSMLPRE